MGAAQLFRRAIRGQPMASRTIQPFVAAYVKIWRATQSHPMTAAILLGELRQGRRRGYVRGQEQPPAFWESVTVERADRLMTWPEPHYKLHLYREGVQILDEVHVSDAAAEPIPLAVKVTAPVMVRTVDPINRQRGQQAAGARGGLLQKIGVFGFLVLKDFGSILSMRPDHKAELLAALREIYDIPLSRVSCRGR
jgi:hypothetical protein